MLSAFLQGPWNKAYEFLYSKPYNYDSFWKRDGDAYHRLQQSKVPYSEIFKALQDMFSDRWWNGTTGEFKGKIDLITFEKHFEKFLPKKKKEKPLSDALRKLAAAQAALPEEERRVQV